MWTKVPWFLVVGEVEQLAPGIRGQFNARAVN